MEVDEVGPSLRYATAKVNRTQRGSSTGGGFGAGSGGGSGSGGGAPADDPWGSAAPADAGAATPTSRRSNRGRPDRPTF